MMQKKQFYYGFLKEIEEPINITLTGQDMINLGWDIDNDLPEDEYILRIDNNKITAHILCSNGEHNDSGFSFEYFETIEDLENYGLIYLKEVEEDIFELKTL